MTFCQSHVFTFNKYMKQIIISVLQFNNKKGIEKWNADSDLNSQSHYNILILKAIGMRNFHRYILFSLKALMNKYLGYFCFGIPEKLRLHYKDVILVL